MAVMHDAGHEDDATTGPRVIVCDDDDHVRVAISGLVEECAGQVIAETDHSADVIALIERFEPDLVVLDLALAQGTGMEVIQFLEQRPDPTRVIVFTAFDGVVAADQAFVSVVRKPDFIGLERALLSTDSGDPAGERRKPVRSVPPTGRRSDDGTDEPDEFYRLLADAHPTDTLLGIDLHGLDVDVAREVRRTVRRQDRLLRRGTSLLALLIGGTAAAADAVQRRLGPVIPDIDQRATRVPVGDDPIEAFDTLTRHLAGESDS